MTQISPRHRSAYDPSGAPPRNDTPGRDFRSLTFTESHREDQDTVDHMLAGTPGPMILPFQFYLVIDTRSEGNP